MSRNSVVLAALVAGVFSVSTANAAVLVTVDKSIQQMTVEVDGRPLYQWPVSTGKAGNYDQQPSFPGARWEATKSRRALSSSPSSFAGTDASTVGPAAGAGGAGLGARSE